MVFTLITQELFQAKVGKYVKQQKENPVYFNTGDMEASRWGKLWYIAGWSLDKSTKQNLKGDRVN